MHADRRGGTMQFLREAFQFRGGDGQHGDTVCGRSRLTG
jgi:hypothetical protein